MRNAHLVTKVCVSLPLVVAGEDAIHSGGQGGLQALDVGKVGLNRIVTTIQVPYESILQKNT
jgi:hypothetical protein